MYSNIADVSYKRLTKTLTVPAGGGHLTFWTSYDTEPEWDHLAVEARVPGSDDWTTLPDANGNTTRRHGPVVPRGLARPASAARPLPDVRRDRVHRHGTTGRWNAATGNSGGWQQWDIDLSDYADEGQVEISIAYISDWSTQGLGVFLDDFTEPDGSTTSFEDGLGGWTVAPAPDGSAPNVNSWAQTDAAGFPEGAAVRTENSLLLGFGLEQVDTPANRTAIMGRAMGDLLGS